jgi:hypothetical protein
MSGSLTLTGKLMLAGSILLLAFLYVGRLNEPSGLSENLRLDTGLPRENTTTSVPEVKTNQAPPESAIDTVSSPGIICEPRQLYDLGVQPPESAGPSSSIDFECVMSRSELMDYCAYRGMGYFCGVLNSETDHVRLLCLAVSKAHFGDDSPYDPPVYCHAIADFNARNLCYNLIEGEINE